MTTSTEPAFAQTQARLDHASHTPGFYYSSLELYRREVECCFMKDWLFAARTQEVPTYGDYLSLRFFDQPVVIARNAAGELHAFYNMCAHRGVEVAFGAGNARTFSCPYHGWSYDLEGKLVGAGFMQQTVGFEVAGCRLKPVHLAVWKGNIFLSFNPEPPPFAHVIARFDEQYALFRLENCTAAHRIVTDLDCNWKLTTENLMDIYHVGVLHANSFGKQIKQQGAPVTLTPDGGYHSWFTGKASTPGGQILLGAFPWLAGQPEGISCNGFSPPNFFVHARFDCIKVFTVWPRGHEKSTIITYHLFATEFFDRPNFKDAMKVYRDFQELAYEEDRTMIQSLQRAMELPAFRPGRMSTEEQHIHNFINGHLRKVLGDHQGATL